MLSKDDIVRVLKGYEWPRDQYWITAGAGMVMHGIRKSTADIDAGCTTGLMDMLLDSNAGEYFEKCGRAIKVDDIIELFENWNVDSVEIIDGFQVASIESIKKQKLKLGREKDMADISAIEAYLSNISK